MKLVELLAKELGEWLEGYRAIVQTIASHTLPVDERPVSFDGSQWDYVAASSDIYNAKFECSELATDHATAIVTREMWQAERDRAVTGQGVSGDAGAKDWRLTESPSLHYQSVGRVYRGEDPRTSRDRIREIDASIEAMTDERAELVSKLAGEGFALIAVTAEPVYDMSDWRNWKAGDILEVVSNTVNHGFNTGETVRYKKEFGSIGCGGKCELLDCSDWWSMDQCDLKFHSSPSA